MTTRDADLDSLSREIATESISYAEPHHYRIVRIEGRAAGFVRLTMGGFFRAHSYRRGSGEGPFADESAAEAWVRTQDALGPVANYSR